MYPIIISAPHAQSKITDKKFRKRIKLNDYEIWKCSDPFTGSLKEFTCAWHKEIGKTHRLVCDLNRSPDKKAFHKYDFFKRRVFHLGQEPKETEKEEILKKHWLPYHDNLANKIMQLDKIVSRRKGPKVILVVEYHNTSGDHPLNQKHEYMPSIILSNLGAPQTGEAGKKKHHISMPSKYLSFFKTRISEQLKLNVEINKIFRGGYNTRWISRLHHKLKTKSRIYVVQVEYNLDFIFNPISKKTDRKALQIMQKGLNKALVKLYKYILKTL